MNSFKSLLPLVELTAMYKSAPTLTELFFTNNFYSNPQNVNSDEVEIINIGATTRPGPGNSRGSAARRIQPKGGSKRYATLFNIFNNLGVPANCLYALREPESYGFQEKGRAALEIQIEEAAWKARLHKECVLRSIIVYHRVNLDVNGEILEPTITTATGALTDASGTVTSADFGIANARRGDCADIFAALWSTAGTKIGEQLAIADRENAKAGAPRIGTILLSSLNKSAIRANTEFNDWAKYNSIRPNAILEGEGIDGLWGKNWRFIDGTWTDVNGTTHDLIPQTLAVLVPDMGNGAWLRKYRGGELVPGSLELGSTLDEIVNQLELVYGEYMYAQLTLNPVNLELYNGDNFGLGMPEVNCMFTVTAFASLTLP